LIFDLRYFEIAFTPFVADYGLTDPAYRSKTRMGFSRKKEDVDHSSILFQPKFQRELE